MEFTKKPCAYAEERAEDVSIKKMRVFSAKADGGCAKTAEGLRVLVVERAGDVSIEKMRVFVAKTDDGYGGMSKTLHILAAYALFLLRRYVF